MLRRLVLFWLRLDLARRWKSLLVLTLIIAAATATVLAGFAGARRGASAFDRLSKRTHPATAAVLPEAPSFNWNAVRALPEVEAVSLYLLRYSFDLQGVSSQIGLAGPSLGMTLSGALPPIDSGLLRTLETPVIYSGRLYNPARDDELVVSRKFVATFHKHVGDTLMLTLPSPKELVSGLDATSSELTGPRLMMHIVGVIGSPWISDSPDSPGVAVLSPGVVTLHPANTTGNPDDHGNPSAVNAIVRLRGGESALPRFRSDVARLAGRSDVDVTDLAAKRAPEQRQIVFESRCLLAFAAAALAAALFLIGQMLARYVMAGAGEFGTLLAVGMSPGQLVLSAAAAPALAGVIGGLLGVGGAVLVSKWLPIGTAALIEPSPGFSWDWVVFGPGLALVALLAATAAAVTAARALRATHRQVAFRRSAVVRNAARLGLPSSFVLGARFALETGRGRGALPVRPALTGAVIGVLGTVAAFSFSRGVSETVTHSQRFGQSYQLGAFVGANSQDYFPSNQLRSVLARSSGVTGVADVRFAVATAARGTGSITLYSDPSLVSSLRPILESGRLPEAPDEVVLGPRSLQSLHARVGSRITLNGSKGSARFTVTGSGLVLQGPQNSYADGGYVTPAGYATLFNGFKYHFQLIVLRPGVKPTAAAAVLEARIVKAFPQAQGFELDPPAPIVEVALLRDVRELPLLLGGFLGLLAVAALGHALTTAVRRRERDLAVLRAVGMTPWQCRWVSITQAGVISLAGLAFGVPLGIAAGRTVWRAVADYTPFEYVPPGAVWGIAVIGPVAVLIAALLAVRPGHRAAGLPVAAILKAE